MPPFAGSQDYTEMRFTASPTGAPKICFPAAGGCNDTATVASNATVKIRVRNTTAKSVSQYELFVNGTSQGAQPWPASTNPIAVTIKAPLSAGTYSVTATLYYSDNSNGASNSIGLTVGSSSSSGGTPPAACFAKADGTCPTTLNAGGGKQIRVRTTTKATGLTPTTYAVAVDGTTVAQGAWPSGTTSIGTAIQTPTAHGTHSVQASVGYSTGASMNANALTLNIGKGGGGGGGGGAGNGIIGKLLADFTKGIGGGLLKGSLLEKRIQRIENAKGASGKIEALVSTAGLRFRGGMTATSTSPKICWPQSGGTCLAHLTASGGSLLTVRLSNHDSTRTPSSYSFTWDNTMTPTPPAVWPSGSGGFHTRTKAPTAVGGHTLKASVGYSDGSTEESNQIHVTVS